VVAFVAGAFDLEFIYSEHLTLDCNIVPTQFAFNFI